MLRALAVALILSACTEAAARGFSSLPSIDSAWVAAAEACRFREDSTAELRLAHGRRLDSLLTVALEGSNEPLELFRSHSLPSGVLRTVSSDKKLVAYSFAVPLSQGAYAYFGHVHAVINSGAAHRVLHASAQNLDAYRPTEPDDWFGGLIYHIEATKYRQRTRYMALVFRPHGQEAQAKWIEPWVVGRSTVRNGKASIPLYFGAAVFSVTDFGGEHFTRPPKRLILRYSPSVSASIRVEKGGDSFLIDELAPMRNGLPGDFRFYGPTLAQDRLYFDRGKWTMKAVEKGSK